MDNIFLPNQKKKEKEQNCGRPTGHNYSHPLDRKQTFLLLTAWDSSCWGTVKKKVYYNTASHRPGPRPGVDQYVYMRPAGHRWAEGEVWGGGGVRNWSRKMAEWQVNNVWCPELGSTRWSKIVSKLETHESWFTKRWHPAKLFPCRIQNRFRGLKPILFKLHLRS